MDAHPLSRGSSPGLDWRPLAILSNRSELLVVLLELRKFEVVLSMQRAARRNVLQWLCVAHLQQSWISLPLPVLSKFNVFADHRVVLANRHSVWIIPTVFAGDICIARACGGTEFDDRSQIFASGGH